nr:hypothetical protein [Crucivirus sp.]
MNMICLIRASERPLYAKNSSTKYRSRFTRCRFKHSLATAAGQVLKTGNNSPPLMNLLIALIFCACHLASCPDGTTKLFNGGIFCFGKMVNVTTLFQLKVKLIKI